MRETLEARGLVDGIAWKVKHPRYPLETWQRFHNAWTGSVRSAVECAFATMKRWYRMGRVRYLGQARNACHLQFVAMAMNICALFDPFVRKDASESAGKRRIGGQTGDPSPRTPYKPRYRNLTPSLPANARPYAKLSDN